MRLAYFPAVAFTVVALSTLVFTQTRVRSHALTARAPSPSITRADPNLKLVFDNSEARVVFANLAAQATAHVTSRRGD